MDLLRTIGPLALALAFTILFDVLTARAGLTPPGMRLAPGAPRPVGEAMLRRTVGLTALALTFYVAAFLALGHLGTETLVDPGSIEPIRLFDVHLILLSAATVWYLVGFAGVEARIPWTRAWRVQFGLWTRSVGRELGIGALAGLAAWVVAILVGLVAAQVLTALGADRLVPTSPPAIVPWIVALPVGLRLLLSASAGLAEEIFFRGLLQPRVGIFWSTLLFIAGHGGYGQPFFFIGIGSLSLIFALLVRWRQSIWAAIAAHAVFDAIQLVIVVPRVLEIFPAT